MIYLDNSATTYPKPKELYEALDYANRNLAFNAGRGNYRYSSEASEVIENARKEVASFVDASPSKVIFTSSATEALNLLIYGLGIEENDNIYISPFEHNAIVRPLHNLKKTINFNIHILPFDKETWELDKEKMINMFARYAPKAVLISHVSNVTGYILPYQEIFAEAKKFDAITILDSAQSYGILNPEIDNVDFCVFAGHKSLYASFGVAGFLYLGNIDLKLVKSGGTGSDSLNPEMPKVLPFKYEAGSPNVVACYGLIASARWLKEEKALEHVRFLTQYLVKRLSEIKKLKIFKGLNEIIGIVSIHIEGYKASEVGFILANEFDICVRTGYHCAPLIHEFIGSLESEGTVRISLGAFNTQEDIDKLIEALKTL